jgi:hypothetical protein
MFMNLIRFTVSCTICGLLALPASCPARANEPTRSTNTREGGVLPIYYEKGKGERELLGYRPGFEPNICTFDNNNRPYMRPWTKMKRCIPDVQTVNVKGEVLTLNAPELPEGYALGPWSTSSDYAVTFDAEGDAYLLIDGTGREDGCWLLAHSRDGCRSWTVYPTPLGRMPGRFKNYPRDNANRPALERSFGSHKPDRPPVIAGNDATHLLLVLPGKKPDGTLEFSEPVRLVNVEGDADVRARSHDLEGFGGVAGPGSIVSVGNKIYLAYIRPRPVEGVSGTPSYVVSYDRQTGAVSKPVFLGGAGIEIDSHNFPRIVADKAGYLHVILGAHGGRKGQHYWYTRSLKPNDHSTWMALEPMPSGTTYPALVCDEKDHLHCFSRDHNGDLVYDRRPSGGPRDERRRVIVPKTRLGYFFYFHTLTMDNQGRLFLSYLSMTREFGPYTPKRKSESHGPNLLMSSDNGMTWQLAEAKHFSERQN